MSVEVLLREYVGSQGQRGHSMLLDLVKLVWNSANLPALLCIHAGTDAACQKQQQLLESRGRRKQSLPEVKHSTNERKGHVSL
eukprot:1161803-Pelagomonas_calceolata.AAC.13